MRPPQHGNRDRRRRIENSDCRVEDEQHLRGQAARQTAGGGRDLQNHAETQIDELPAGTRRRHRARGGDDGEQVTAAAA